MGSTLADPYLAYAGGLNALAGPLHGLANQEVLGWILDLQKKFKAEGKQVNHQTITDFAWETLNSGACVRASWLPAWAWVDRPGQPIQR